MTRKKIEDEQMQPLINEEKKVYLTPRRILRTTSNFGSSGNNNLAMRHSRILIISSLFAFLLFVHIIIFSNVKIYNQTQVLGWSKNTSRVASDYIFPELNTTLIEPSTICSSLSDPPIFLLIVVCSSFSNFEARQAIRTTWGNTTEFNYSLFEKFHGNNSSYLNINSKQWRKYEEVCEKIKMLTRLKIFLLFLKVLNDNSFCLSLLPESECF
jgi:hypothetical protein